MSIPDLVSMHHYFTSITNPNSTIVEIIKSIELAIKNKLDTETK